MDTNRIERKHYIIGALILVIAFTIQPFATLATQIVLGPKLVTILEGMKTDPMADFYSMMSLDQDKLAMCSEDPAIAKIIEDDTKLGESLGVTGTPSTFIGKRNAVGDIVLYKEAISGALPTESVMEAINSKTKVMTANVIKNEKLHIYGNPEAETILVEFSDLECPFCARFHPTIKGIVDNSGGKIAYVYKHYPLPFHPKAVPLATSAECVASQKGEAGFFEFIDANFNSMNQ